MARRKKEKKEEQISESTKKSPKAKADKKKIKEKRTTQNSIGYEKILRSGVAMLGNNLYSQTEKFEDINYNIAPEEDQQGIFGRYMNLLNSDVYKRQIMDRVYQNTLFRLEMMV